MLLQVGEEAPDFSAPADDGETIKLSSFRGKKVVLYFYPRDNTPSCTTEACGFRDNYHSLTHRNCVVLGVSGDSSRSHDKFKARHNLPFPLISDRDHSIAKSYGAWRKGFNLGTSLLGTIRSTFIIDEEGRIQTVFGKVKAQGHVAEVLAAL